MRGRGDSRSISVGVSEVFTVLLVLIGVILSAGVHAKEPVSAATSPSAQVAERPRLVVAITVDGLRADTLTRFADQIGEGGFKRLIRNGAWFTNARYTHQTTYTAVGHSVILSGTHPYQSGMVANDWHDRTLNDRMYCVEDRDSPYLGEPTKRHMGTSPRNFKGSTVGDELLMSNNLMSKVVSVSNKDRGAILTGGRLGKSYWWSYNSSGRYVTSTYYMKDYPEWHKRWHEKKLPDQYFNYEWKKMLPEEAYRRSARDDRPYETSYKGLGRTFPHRYNGGLDKPGSEFYAVLPWGPPGDEVLLDFAIAAIHGEGLGRNPNGAPDLFAVSFSAQDYMNHLFGPESPESQDNFLRLDRTLAKLFEWLDQWIGMDSVLLVLTADHGFEPIPEWAMELGLPGGRVDPEKMLKAVNEHLGKVFGEDEWTAAWWNPNLYLNDEAIAKHKLSRTEVENEAARFLLNYEGISEAYTRTQLENGTLPRTPLAQRAQMAFNRKNSGDAFVIQKPWWYVFGNPLQYGSTHGSSLTYDTHVPVIFMGRHIRPGVYKIGVEVVDIAPTISDYLGIVPPPMSDGRVLHEIMK